MKVWPQVLIGVLSAVGGYWFHALQENRSNAIKRLEAQLHVLYTPLRADVSANTETWDEFRKTHRPGRPYFDGTQSREDVDTWRRYMKNTFQPQNVVMEETITKNAEQLVDGKVPLLFNRIIAHVEAYRAVIAKWPEKVSDDPKTLTAEENTVLVNFPDSEPLMLCLNQQIDSLQEALTEAQGILSGLLGDPKPTVPNSCNEEPKENKTGAQR
jgi:hypothetical protein